MRSMRSFLILVVVALAVGGYAYFVDSKKDLTDPATKKAKVFTMEPGKIQELEIHNAAGITTKVVKSGDTWQISAPEVADADSSEVGTVVSTIESLEQQRVVDEKPADVSGFGLAPARITVSFKVTGDSAPRKLKVGNKTPAGSDLYAQVEGDSKLFLISGFLEESLNRSTFDLRDKTVLKFAREGADMLTLAVPGSPEVSLSKKGSDWMLEKPMAAKADFGSVDTIMNKLSQAKMKSIVTPGSRPVPEVKKDDKAKADAAKKPETSPKPEASPKPADKAEPAKAGEKPTDKPAKAAFDDSDYKAYGLDKPQVVATVGVGSTRAALAIGGRFDETSVYARDLSRPVVFTLDKTIVDDLKKKSDDLRVKDIFEFRSYTASAVDITYGGVTYSFEKKTTAAKDPNTAATDQWKQTKPAAKEIDQGKFSDLLTSLSNVRAEKFADKPVSSGEELVVHAKFGEAAALKDETATLRKSGTVAQAIRSGDNSPAVIPVAEFDKIVNAVKDLIGKK